MNASTNNVAAKTVEQLKAELAAAQVYMGHRIAVANKIALLNQRLEALDTEAEAYPADWSYAGSIAHVEDQLQETLATLSFLK